MKNLRAVMSDRRLSAYSKNIFSYLLSISNENGICSKKRTEILQDLNICPRTFEKNVKKLEYCRYLHVCRQIFRKNVYILLPKYREFEDLQMVNNSQKFPVWKSSKTKNNDGPPGFPVWNPGKN